MKKRHTHTIAGESNEKKKKKQKENETTTSGRHLWHIHSSYAQQLRCRPFSPRENKKMNQVSSWLLLAPSVSLLLTTFSSFSSFSFVRARASLDLCAVLFGVSPVSRTTISTVRRWEFIAGLSSSPRSRLRPLIAHIEQQELNQIANKITKKKKN